MAIPTGTLLRRALRRRCPVCAQKKIFRRWVRMAERCPQCHLRFQREPGAWLGSWFLNICLAQILVVITVAGGVAVFYPTPPFLALGLAGFVLTVGFPIFFFPYSRMLWVAIDLAMQPLRFDEGVDPIWELAADARKLEEERRAGTGAS